MKSAKTKLVALTASATLTFGCVAPTSAAVVEYGSELENAPDKSNYWQTFTDVPQSHWAFGYIGEMVDRGVLDGYMDGKFYPEKNVSRAEFAKIMTTAAGLSVDYAYNVGYVDVGTHWAAPYISTASYYLSGFTSNGSYYYYPDSAALREDIAVALVKLKGYSTHGYDLSLLRTMFTDYESISRSARPYVAIAIEKGLISGYDDSTFRGQQGITRAEAATLLWRAYQYGNDNKFFDDDFDDYDYDYDYDDDDEPVSTPKPTATPTPRPTATPKPTPKATATPKPTEEPESTFPYEVDSLTTAKVSDTYLTATQDNNDNLYYYDSSSDTIYKLNMKTGKKSKLLDISSLTYEVYKDEEQEVTKTIVEKVPTVVYEEIEIDEPEDDDLDEDSETKSSKKTQVVEKTVYEEVEKEVTTIETVSVLQGRYKDFTVDQLYYNTGNDKLLLTGTFEAYKSERSHEDKSTDKSVILEVGDSDTFYDWDFRTEHSRGWYNNLLGISGNMDNGNVVVNINYESAVVYDIYNENSVNNIGVGYAPGFFYSNGKKSYYCKYGRVYEYNFSRGELVSLWDDEVGSSAHGLNNKTYYAWNMNNGEINKIKSDGEPKTLKINTKTDVEVNDFYNMPTRFEHKNERIFITNDESIVFYDTSANGGTWRKISKQ